MKLNLKKTATTRGTKLRLNITCDYDTLIKSYRQNAESAQKTRTSTTRVSRGQREREGRAQSKWIKTNNSHERRKENRIQLRERKKSRVNLLKKRNAMKFMLLRLKWKWNFLITMMHHNSLASNIWTTLFVCNMFVALKVMCGACRYISSRLVFVLLLFNLSLSFFFYFSVSLTLFLLNVLLQFAAMFFFPTLELL